VINSSLAKELWLTENPINKSVRLIYPSNAGLPTFSEIATVIGITEDMHPSGVMESSAPTVFKAIKGAPFMDFSPSFIVRGSTSGYSLELAAGQVVGKLMPGLAVDSSYDVSGRARTSTQEERGRAYFALAGALAMALVAGIGLYGSLVYYVGSRRRELAIRICMGASPWTIQRYVLERAAKCSTSAVILSLPLWWVLARVASGDFFGRISWSTPRAIAISFGCVCISIFISLVPAVSASSVLPSELLRDQ